MEQNTSGIERAPMPKTEKGLGRVADIYISDDFDLNATVTPSEVFLALSSTSEISENTKTILCEMFHSQQA